MAAARRGDADADRRRGAEGPQRVLGGAAVAACALGGHARRAGPRLDRRALRHAADPRRRAAAEGEVVLPGDEAVASRAELHEPVERPAQRRSRARSLAAAAHRRDEVLLLALPRRDAEAELGVHPAPARELLELHAVARVVLEDRRVVAERLALPGRGERGAAPELVVAAQDEEDRGEAAGGQAPARRERLDR